MKIIKKYHATNKKFQNSLDMVIDDLITALCAYVGARRNYHKEPRHRVFGSHEPLPGLDDEEENAGAELTEEQMREKYKKLTMIASGHTEPGASGGPLAYGCIAEGRLSSAGTCVLHLPMGV